jgi:hypothetical protein
MATEIHLKQSTINAALIVGKITCGLLSNRIAKAHFNGDNDQELFADLVKVWGWVDALNEVYEVDDSTVYEWMNYLDEATAREVIEKINRIARKRLPKLVIDKVLQNKLELI